MTPTDAPMRLARVPAFQQAQEAIRRVREAGNALAFAVAQEAELVREKPGQKVNAIRRSLGSTNDLNGKPHSASSAEAIVELDPEYRAFLRQLSAATCEVILAKTDYVAARLEAQLHLATLLTDEEHDDERN